MKSIIITFAILFLSAQINAQLSGREFISLAVSPDIADSGGAFDDFRALNRSGIRAAEEEGDIRKAATLFARATQAAPSCQVCRYNHARALIRLGSHSEAAGLLEQVVAAEPGFAEAFASLGDAHSLSGNTEAGLENYRKAISLSPDDAATLNNYANALEASGSYALALEYFDKAVTAGPGLVEAHCNRGVLLFRMGKREEALWSLRKAERLGPEDPSTLSNIGVVLDSLGEKDIAAGYYRKALDSAPDFAPALFNLGLISIEEGDRHEAAAVLRKLEAAEVPLASELRKRFSSKWVINASDLARRSN